MKLNISTKSFILLILVLNSECIQIERMGKKEANTTRQSLPKMSPKLSRLSRKFRFKESKSQDPGTQSLYTTFLVTQSVEAIATVISGYAAQKEAMIKDLKVKSLSTLSNMFEEMQLLKTALCNNVRNSNFLFFDLLSFFIMDIYFLRKMVKDNNTLFPEELDPTDEAIKKILNKNDKNLKTEMETRIKVLNTKLEQKSSKLKTEASKVVNEWRNLIQNKNAIDERRNILDKKLEVLKSIGTKISMVSNQTEIIANPNNQSISNDSKTLKQNLNRFLRKSAIMKSKIINLEEDEKLDAFLMPYDQMSQNLFEIKQTLKSFQNKICSINEDAIGEMTYIAARSRGLALDIQESSEGSFFMVSNLLLDFSTLFVNLGMYSTLSVMQSPEKLSAQMKQPGDFQYDEKTLGDFDQRTKDLSNGASFDSKDIIEYTMYKDVIPPFLTDPITFVRNTGTDLKRIFRIFRINQKAPVINSQGQKLDKGTIKKQFLESLTRFTISMILISDFIKFCLVEVPSKKYNEDGTTTQGTESLGLSRATLTAVKGSIFSTKILLLFSLQAALIHTFDFNDARERLYDQEKPISDLEKSAQLKIYKKKRKLMIVSLTKFSFVLAYTFFQKALFMKIVKVIVLQIAATFKSSGTADDITRATMSVMNVFIVLRVAISVLKVFIAVMRLIKASRELRNARIDFMGEEKLKDNYVQQFRIQAIYITLRQNSLIHSTFLDILKFYDIHSKSDVLFLDNLDTNEGVIKKKLKDLTNEEKREVQPKDNKASKDHMAEIDQKEKKSLSPTRYNALPVHKFLLTFCQENETHCFNYLTPNYLKQMHRSKKELTNEHIDVIFKFIYNDIVAGPITDVFVTTPRTTTLTVEYLRRNNFRFYKKKGNFGVNYALLYRRCGNANNYLYDFQYETMDLPLKLADTFQNERSFKNKKVAGDEKIQMENLQVNTFFTGDGKDISEKGFKRDYIMVKMMITKGIDRLRGNEALGDLDDIDGRPPDRSQNQTQYKLRYSFSDNGFGIYNFRDMFFDLTQGWNCNSENFYIDCWYLFSKIETETPTPFSDALEFQKEIKGMDIYVNSCYNDALVSSTVVAMNYRSKNEAIYPKRLNIFSCASNQNVVTHYTFFDKRFYTPEKICSGSFQLIDKRMIKINKNYLSDTSESFLESQIKCFSEQIEIKIKRKEIEEANNEKKEGEDEEDKEVDDGKENKVFEIMDAAAEIKLEMYNEQKIDYLKSRTDIIKSAICETYDLFKNEDRFNGDSKCTRATTSDFRFLFILSCFQQVINTLDKDKKDNSFFGSIEKLYKVDYKADESNTWMYNLISQSKAEEYLNDKRSKTHYYTPDENASKTNTFYQDEEKQLFSNNTKGDQIMLLGATYALAKTLNTEFCPQATPIYKFWEYSTSKKYMNFLRFENNIPTLTDLVNMKVQDTKLYLLRYNMQFYSQESNEQYTNIPNFSKIDEKENDGKPVYPKIRDILIGERFSSSLFFGRAGGKFHILIPATRAIDLPLLGINSKLQTLGNIVFRVDSELTGRLQNYQKLLEKKSKGVIFKLAIDKLKENVTEVKDQIDQQWKINTHLERIRNLKYDTRPNQKKITVSEMQLEYAPMAKNFYVEFSLFKKVSWWMVMSKDYKDAMNLKGLEYLLDLCFIMYWPQLDKDDVGTETFKAEEPAPSVNYYMPFRYSFNWTLMTRIWIKFDYVIRDEVIKNICEKKEISEKENEKVIPQKVRVEVQDSELSENIENKILSENLGGNFERIEIKNGKGNKKPFENKQEKKLNANVVLNKLNLKSKNLR